MAGTNSVTAPTVVPQVGAPARFTQQITPLDAGENIGQQAQRLGGAIEQSGDVGFKAALAYKELDNETAAKNAQDDFFRNASGLLFSPDGYFNKAGKDAYDGYGDAVGKLEALRRSTLDALPNARSQLMADTVISRSMRGYQDMIGQHSQQGRKQWMNDTTDSLIQSTTDNGINFYNNDKVWGQTVATLKDYVLQKGEQNGWGPEQTQQAQAAQVSKAWTGRIERMAVNDPMGAEQLYRDNIDSIDGATHTAIEQHLKQLVMPVETRALADRVMTGQATAKGGDLVNAVIARESNGMQDAVSSKGAIGIMQLMPDTAREIAAKIGVPFDPVKLKDDPEYNRQLGTAYLQDNLRRYGGDQTLALAAYNAGPARVDGWLKSIGDPRTGAITSEQFAQAIPIAETRDYVQAINDKVPPQAGTVPTSQDVRDHLQDWIGQTRDAAKSMWPNNPEAVDQAVTHVITYASQIQHGAQFAEKGARDTLMVKALGLQSGLDGSYVQLPGGQRPATLEALLSDPKSKQAWAQMDPVQQGGILTLLEHNAKGENPTLTQPALEKYYELRGMAARAPDAFADVNLADRSVTDLLPHEKTIELMNMQAALVTKQARDVTKMENLQHALTVARPSLMAMGIDVKPQSGTTGAATYDQFTGRLAKSLDDFVTANKRAPSDLEVKGMTNSLLTQGAQLGTGWFFNDKVRLFQSPDAAQFRATVPAVERPKIIADYKSIYGHEPSDAQIGDIFTASQLRKAGGK